ncbi:putative Lipopolysaccharide glucosyltransferase I [uncultured delta proteobacterium]|uniref:Putative Lipopolysaccharide glucosyltransferase I n=1 Tax=uncultured delta proteobacterium TaxID=34034 RepID=A0A212JWK1_9DELT|nr:putative Lipopolysaccharide glucosyltransferase I [uncultured delta proteobacterium]
MGHMHIVFTPNRAYLPYCAVAAASICRHLRTGERVTFHILHGGDIQKKDRREFSANLANFHDAFTAEFIAVNDFHDFSRRASELSVQTPAAYYRLYIPDLFPDLERVLYLDADLVACRSLEELYELDIEGFVLAGVEDAYATAQAQRLSLQEGTLYVNGGVLLWNMREIDRKRFHEDLSALLDGNLRCVMNAADQDMLNILFHGRTKRLDPRWNVQLQSSTDALNTALLLCGAHNSMPEKLCRLSLAQPYLIHYAVGGKPWVVGKRGEALYEHWFANAKMTGYYNEHWKRLEADGPPAGTRRAPEEPQTPDSVRAGQNGRSCAKVPPASPAPVGDAAKDACINALALRHATRRAALSFDMESVFTRPATRIGSDMLPGFFGRGGTYEPLLSLFSAPSVTRVQCREDAERADLFIPGHTFSDASLDALIAMLQAVDEAGKNLLWIKGGFITSILHGAAPESHIPACYKRVLGYVIDDITPSFDAVLPSRLELYFNSKASSLDLDETRHCRERIDYIVTNRLTKYNFQGAPVPEKLQTTAPKVLVVDQAYGDASIRRGGADGHTFAAMLQAARDENPGAQIVVKTHPDVAALGKSCYYAHLPEEGHLLKLTEPVNPYTLFPHVDRVYVCTSQLGFEALLAGKRVTVFGLPAYAGWGLTDDRQSCPRRTRTLSLEELFFGIFLKYGLYFDPHTLERCSFETFLLGMVRLRNEYCEFVQKYNESEVYA